MISDIFKHVYEPRLEPVLNGWWLVMFILSANSITVWTKSNGLTQ